MPEFDGAAADQVVAIVRSWLDQLRRDVVDLSFHRVMWKELVDAIQGRPTRQLYGEITIRICTPSSR